MSNTLISLLGLLLGCTGSSVEDPRTEQLRGLGVNVAGFNVLHGDPASREAGTDLGPTALQVDAYLEGGTVPVRIVGSVEDWQAELVGDVDAFTFLVGDFGDLRGVACVPPAVGLYAADMVVTAASQPGREFRVAFACEGDDRARILPFAASALGADGTLAGTQVDALGNNLVAVLPPTGDLHVLPDIGSVPRSGVTDAGGVLFSSPDGLRYVAPGASTSTLVLATVLPALAPFVSADGEVVLVTDPVNLYRIDRATGTGEIVGPTARLHIVWASTDGDWALIATGTDHDLVLVDTESGAYSDFLDPEGAPWVEGAGVGVAALSPDRTELLLATSYYYEVGLARVQIATGESVELLDRAKQDMADRFDTTNHALSGVHVTPDFRFAAVVFDNIAADPGGFQLRGSAVYVIDLEDGTTWLANVNAGGQVMHFAKGSFEGRLIEQVALRPDAGAILFADRYVTDASLWLEVP